MTDPQGETNAAPDDRAAPGGIRSVQRALELLSLFDERRLTWTISGMARASGLPKTTVVRLVGTLVDNGMLWTRPDAQVTVGAGLLRWARLAGTGWNVPEPARIAMTEVTLTCGEAVNVYVRQGTTRLCVAAFDGPRNPRYVIEVGTELPLWAGCASKVLLSEAPADVLQAAAARSPHGSDFVQVLNEQAEKARTLGFAVSHGEREPGISGVAAPIRDAEGSIVAAVAIGGPTTRFTDEKVDEFATAVTALAKRCTELGLAKVFVS